MPRQMRRYGEVATCALLLGANCVCGGKAVVDGELDGGSSGMTTSTEPTGSTTTTSSTVDPCVACAGAEPGVNGQLEDAAINEASGIVASALHRSWFYVHNDSGDSPRFWAMDQLGKNARWWSLDGAEALDWEDMTRGPCRDTSCLYFGDIGDNNEVRDSYDVYRVPEPADLDQPSVTWERIRFLYPDGKHNAETLLATPEGQLFIVTKVSSGKSGIYAFPLDPPTSGTITLAWVGDVEPPSGDAKFTAGDAGPHGILLRTYSDVWLYPWRGRDLAQSLAGEPCPLVPGAEIQGEAIAWWDFSFVTVSEGVGSKIYLSRCER